jgi:hypothetical protein
MNPNAIHLLEQNPDKIEWDYLSLNPNAIHLLEANPEKIRWYGLSKNPSAGHLLQSNINKLDWSALSENTCPEAIQLLEMYPNCINWTKLSRNPAAIHICKKYPTKFIPPKPGKVVFDTIKWEWVVEKPVNTIDISKTPWNTWGDISADPRAIQSLEQYPDRIRWCHDDEELIRQYYNNYDSGKEPWEEDWKTVWLNPAIFDVS